jgi:hypothetical protein
MYPSHRLRPIFQLTGKSNLLSPLNFNLVLTTRITTLPSVDPFVGSPKEEAKACSDSPRNTVAASWCASAWILTRLLA